MYLYTRKKNAQSVSGISAELVLVVVGLRKKSAALELAKELFTMYARLAFGVTMIVAAVCVLLGQFGVL